VTAFNPRLITPPEEEKEIYPYRRVWRSLILEAGALFGVAAVLFVVSGILSIAPPARFYQIINVALALLPVGLWLLFSWRNERLVPQPRQRLITVMMVSGLVANAIGVPLVDNFLQPDRWLSLASAIDRIVGYTFTVGIVQEVLKYVVVRYAVWPDCFRTRLDAIAYCAASAIGYATVVNLHFALSYAALPYFAALRVFDTVAINLAASIVVAYGLAEITFSKPSPFVLMLTVALAAFVKGASIPLRSGLVNASLFIPVPVADKVTPAAISSVKPAGGLGLGAGVLLVIALTVSFLMAQAELRDREAAAHQEH
jgi:protease PrsW